MCPFCIGTVAWAAVGAVSAGGLGALAAVVRHRGGPVSADDAGARRDQSAAPGPGDSG
jgi:hypothetical protein